LKMVFVLATQHPTADVISTAIKANLVTSIAFKTRDQSSSRLIVGVPMRRRSRAGDCLVQAGTLTRVQGGWVTGPRERQPSDIGAIAVDPGGFLPRPGLYGDAFQRSLH